MTKNEGITRSEIKFTCREAHLILRRIPLRKSGWDMDEEEKDAVTHYLYCKHCRELGLEGILSHKLTCEEAILFWAEDLRALHLNFIPSVSVRHETLLEIYAIEHVWAKYEWKDEKSNIGGYKLFSGCDKRPCEELRSYWHDVPMSCFNDGASGVINEIPFLIRVFLEEEWDLKPLLEIQYKRMEAVIDSLKNGKITVSEGHYNEMEELVAELLTNISILQKLAINSLAPQQMS